MDITPLIPASRQVIEGYGDGGFTISGQRREGSVIVFPDNVAAWRAVDVAALRMEDLLPVTIRAGHVELLLLGCGAKQQPVSSALRAELKKIGIVLEAMDTGAACRTYNMLLAEGRRLAAALIAV